VLKPRADNKKNDDRRLMLAEMLFIMTAVLPFRL